MGKNQPMHVQFYNYRVEFQMRGAGHIHGVLWLNLEELEPKFPNLREIMKKLRLGETLNEANLDVMVKFVDTFVYRWALSKGTRHAAWAQHI